MRRLLFVVLVACGSHEKKAEPETIDRGLDCSLQRVDAVHDFDTAQGVLDVLHAMAPREVEMRGLRRARVIWTQPTNLAKVAVAFARLGEKDNARTLATEAADRAKTANDPELLEETSREAALALAWAGDGQGAVRVAGHDPFALMSVVEGEARAGDQAGATKALDEAKRNPPAEKSPLLDVMEASNEVLAGRVAAAKKTQAAQANPTDQLYLALTIARMAVEQKLPTAGQLLKDADELGAKVAAGEGVDPVSLFSLRLQVSIFYDDHGDHDAARKLRAELSHTVSDPDVLAALAINAYATKQLDEAEGYYAMFGAKLRTDVKIARAVATGHVDETYALIGELPEEEKSSAGMIVWQTLAAKNAPTDKLAAAICPITK